MINRQEQVERENIQLSSEIRQLKTDKLELEIALREKSEVTIIMIAIIKSIRENERH